MRNGESMKKRNSKRSALLVFVLLLIGMSLMDYVWVRKEKRQYAMNRQLIASLLKNDTKQALVLVEAGLIPTHRKSLLLPLRWLYLSSNSCILRRRRPMSALPRF